MKNMKLVNLDVSYYTTNNLEEFQMEMFEILNYIDEICKANDLTYFIDGGSLLGCYRDESIIPWDDDIDISMLKKDYIQLINLINKDADSGYYLYDETSSNHACNFLVKKGSLFQKVKGKFFNYIMPPKVDIRPINVICDEEKNKTYRDVANYIIFGKAKFSNENKIKDVIKEFKGKDKFLHWYNTEYGNLPLKDDCHLSHPYFEYSIDGCFNQNELLPIKNKLFSVKEYPVPKESFLIKFYGDYKLYPPVSERRPVADEILYYNDNDSELINEFHYKKKNGYKISIFLFIRYLYISFKKVAEK